MTGVPRTGPPSVPMETKCDHCGRLARIELDMMTWLTERVGTDLLRQVGLRFPYRCPCGRKPYKDRHGVSRIDRFHGGQVLLA